MSGRPIYLVDDDAAIRRALTRLLRSHGYQVEAFGEARPCLERLAISTPDCLLLDLRLPELSGLELQELLAESPDAPPIVFISGQAEVPESVRAMKAGAVDFLSKPFAEEALLGAIEAAIARRREERAKRREVDRARALLARLTPRERQVCALVAQGMLNKQIAARLGTAEKTVKVHRAQVMSKLEVGSVAELVRVVDGAQSD